MTERDILLWAAGGRRPETGEVDRDRLLSLVRSHQLATRMRRRIAEERPGWAGPALVAGLDALVDEARQRVRRQYEALVELRDAVPGPVRPLLSKGMAFVLMTGDERMIRRFHDLDLFGRDLPRLLASLVRLGYAVDRKDPPEPLGRRIFHEYAKASRDDVVIDLHSRFPAWGYPSEVASAETTAPAFHPGVWRSVEAMRRGEIGTESLFRSSLERPGFDGRPALITNAEMTALVTCCHLFANYVAEFPLPQARIKLGELANLGDLLAQPGFRWQVFERLALEHHASDAVAYVLALLARWLGHAPRGPAAARRPHEALPPRALWFARGRGGFVVSTAPAECPEDVIVRTTRMAHLVDHLGGIALGSGPWYGTGRAPGIPQRRWLIHGAPPPIAFRLAWNDQALEATVRVAEGRPCGELDVLCDFGERVIEFVEHDTGELHAYDRRVERRIDTGTLGFRRLPGPTARRCYRLTVPWSMLPTGFAADARLPLLLGVRRWPAAGDYPQDGMLIPLVLTATSGQSDQGPTEGL